MDKTMLRRFRRGHVPQVDRARDGACLGAALVDWLSSQWRSGAPFESQGFSRSPPHVAAISVMSRACR